MVEAAILLPIVFLIIGGLVEFGIAFHRYSLISDTLSRTARTSSIASADFCADIADQAAAELSTALNNLNIGGLSIEPNPPAFGNIDVPASTEVAPYMNLRVVWQRPCLICYLVPGLSRLQLSNLAVLEGIDACEP